MLKNTDICGYMTTLAKINKNDAISLAVSSIFIYFDQVRHISANISIFEHFQTATIRFHTLQFAQ